MLLLPTGGIQVYGSPEALARAGEPRVQTALAVVGPLASFLFAATVAGLILTVAPQVNLWEKYWVTPQYLLRTMVWVNLLLAAVNLLPAWPLDAGRVVRAEIVRGPGGPARRSGRSPDVFTRVGPDYCVRADSDRHSYDQLSG